jgi:hypothetical protein
MFLRPLPPSTGGGGTCLMHHRPWWSSGNRRCPIGHGGAPATVGAPSTIVEPRQGRGHLSTAPSAIVEFRQPSVLHRSRWMLATVVGSTDVPSLRLKYAALVRLAHHAMRLLPVRFT